MTQFVPFRINDERRHSHPSGQLYYSVTYSYSIENCFILVKMGTIFLTPNNLRGTRYGHNPGYHSANTQSEER